MIKIQRQHSVLQSLAFIFVLFLLTPQLYAVTHKAVGIGTGALSGNGFTFRLYHNDQSASHFAGFIVGNSDNLYANVAYEHLFLLTSYKTSRLYWFAGASNHTVVEQKLTTSNVNNYLAFGPGIGYEWGKEKGFTVAIELPLSFIWAYETSQEVKLHALPIPSLMLLYRM